MSAPVRISTADFIKKFGELADLALAEPLRITKHGRDRLVVLSAAEYDRLKRRDRRVVRVEDLTDEDLDLIAQAEVPAEFAYLDAELENWKP
ncbi:MAG TPA: type II toxin-antitoxin system prevent-host-death family antitoxin [Caulobacteraceae bacterium]|nr:type II toxin-antitoxin system prevent-host-death family antitoxin [Caulobacteraceae bacterium]